MGSSGSPTRIRVQVLAVGFLAACGGCATQVSAPAPEPSLESSAEPTQAFEAGIDLPEGPGREILVTSCLACHDLVALTLFKGFYTRDSWKALVLTMVGNGAELDAAEVEVLADYLERYFGPSSG